MNAKTMKRKALHVAEPEMRPEYDFSGAVRGKYYRRYLESTNVVVIEPDVHKKFKNSAAVKKICVRLFAQPAKGEVSQSVPRGRAQERRAPVAADADGRMKQFTLAKTAFRVPQNLKRRAGPRPRLPLYESGKPRLAERAGEALTGFGGARRRGSAY